MKRFSPGLLLSTFLWLAWLLLVAPAVGAQQTGHGKASPASSRQDEHTSHSRAQDSRMRLPTDARLELPDVTVLNQDGRELKFYSDLVKGRLVVISFIYTTCHEICPVAGRNFAQLQNALGERFGRDVFLISVSTDPARDTPPRLKAWAQAVGARTAGGGWTLLTGEPEQIASLLKVLTGDGARTGYHVPAVYMHLDTPGGRAAWAYGLAAPRQLLKTLESLGTPVATRRPHSHE